MLTHALHEVLQRVENAASACNRPKPVLLAVSKTQSAAAIAELAALGQRAFGENYVQEAAPKQAELAPLGLEWHLIGHLQSNKAKEAATRFEWVQTVDRESLVTALNKHRPAGQARLNVLIQVNIDDETSKHGCRPEDVEHLAAVIDAQPHLRLRGLMVIPTPYPDVEARRPAFRRTRELFEALRSGRTQVDTLSMGMSDDLEVAIAEGSTLVRVGTALFGVRPAKA